MRKQITKDDLYRRIERLNKLTGAPQQPYQDERDPETGNLIPNAGNHSLTGAYGRWDVDRMCEGGGATGLFGYCTKRELFDRLGAYLDGIEDEHRRNRS